MATNFSDWARANDIFHQAIGLPVPQQVAFIARETRPTGVGPESPAVKLPSAATLAGS